MPLFETSRASVFAALLQRELVKTITLTPPWSSFMALKNKLRETRSWMTAYQGPLAIHAAKGFPGWAQDLCEQEPFCSLLDQGGFPYQEGVKTNPRGLPVGRVVAVGWLEQVEHITRGYEVSPLERALGNYAPGRYAWCFSSLYRLATPIEARGSLGLWNWQPPESFWAEIRAQSAVQGGML